MEKRLSKIEQHLGADEPEREQALFVNLADWPEADAAAFLAGDRQQRSDLVARHCGRRPAGAGRYVNTIVDVSPAPMNPGDAIPEVERIVREKETTR